VSWDESLRSPRLPADLCCALTRARGCRSLREMSRLTPPLDDQVTHSWLSRIERGCTPSRSTALLIADAYGLSASLRALLLAHSADGHGRDYRPVGVGRSRAARYARKTEPTAPERGATSWEPPIAT